MVGWVEKLKMSKIDYGHEVPIVIHKNEAISLIVNHYSLFNFGAYSHTKIPPKGYHEKNIKWLITCSTGVFEQK